MNHSCSAIVPALDENDRIGHVVAALSESSCITDIIVVDDGSREPLAETLTRFPKVRCIRHGHTKGKAAAIESGVAASGSPYLFFCDADLERFTAEHVRALVEPVISGAARMSIGLRDNPEQRAVYWFAINSGERALPREDWESLPAFYKKGFRLEAGLNVRAWMRGDTVLHLYLPYGNTLREKKYGLWRGIRSRTRLCIDVGLAWAHAFLFRSR